MKFRVIPNGNQVPREGRGIAYLLTDNWDDWFEFNTVYILTYFDQQGERRRLGAVKIGQFDMEKEQRRPNIPDEFDSLDERFFSLGQDADYYEEARKLGTEIGRRLLEALNDVVVKRDLYWQAKKERVTGVSLMRTVNERTLTGQFRRVFDGGARLTNYAFRYCGPKQLEPTLDPVELTFSVQPFSKPPTNIQVIIGRNGVGKSFLLNAMSRALVYPNESVDDNGKFVDDQQLEDEFQSPFSNVVSVTFSAFDDFPVIRQKRNTLEEVQYTNVGLRKYSNPAIGEANGSKPKPITQQPNELTQDFIRSAKICAQGERRDRWFEALKTLQSDPIFEEAAVALLLDEIDPSKLGRRAGFLFRKLSSGHKIVLLTITRLVEKVEERTLVLMDEPETHLHPPLLSAFIRALSDLLSNRNGVAVIATHSPVVLQEVPTSCVWKIRRHGGAAVAERLRVETFAEHVGHLTHEVFGLEVRQSGFHKLIAEAIGAGDDFDAVSQKFHDEVGSEGRALISAILATGVEGAD